MQPERPSFIYSRVIYLGDDPFVRWNIFFVLKQRMCIMASWFPLYEDPLRCMVPKARNLMYAGSLSFSTVPFLYCTFDAIPNPNDNVGGRVKRGHPGEGLSLEPVIRFSLPPNRSDPRHGIRTRSFGFSTTGTTVRCRPPGSSSRQNIEGCPGERSPASV